MLKARTNRIIGYLLVLLVGALFVTFAASNYKAPEVSAYAGARSYYNSSTGDVFLGGNFIELGISRGGSFGTNASAPSNFYRSGRQLGMIVDKDGWGVGNAPTTGDFFLPGTPEECYIFSYNYNGTRYEFRVADRNGGSTSGWKSYPSASDQSEGDMLKAVVSGVTNQDVRITITYMFGVNDLAYVTTVDIENNSSKPISDVRFVRSFDPDQDQETQGTYDTYNKVICNPVSTQPASSENFAMVVARGASTYEGFFFVAFDNRARGSRGVAFELKSAYASGLWYDSAALPTYATDELTACSPSNRNGYTKEDNAIAITFALGSVGSKGTDHLEYYSSLNPNVEDSLDIISRPITPQILSVTGAELQHGYTEGGVSIDVKELTGYSYEYQWYRNDTEANTNGTLIQGATAKTYQVPLKHLSGTTEYYYCAVKGTRLDNLRTVTTYSLAIPVVYLDGEHDISVTVISDPDCTHSGQEHHQCQLCAFEETVVTPASGHEYVVIEENKSCQGPWNTVYKCTVCNDIKTVTHESVDHPFVIVDQKEPTCEESGYVDYQCSMCGETRYSYVSPLGHNYQTRVIKEGSCTEDGIIEYYCTRCEDSYRVTVKAEHNYQLVETKAANCRESGYQLFRCSVCDDEYKIEIPADAAHAYAMEIVKNATKEEDGLIKYTCSVCGDEYTEVIPAFGDGVFVLLVQDNTPWSGNDNVTLLNRLVAGGYIAGWDLTTTANFTSLSLDKYAVILIANDQTTATYNKLRALNSAISSYLSEGGAVVYGACGYGWNSGSVGTLPGGVSTGNFYSMRNYIVNSAHPVVSGSLTDGNGINDELLLGTYCSHVYFDAATLPEDANVILQDANGNATLVEYAYGNGFVIASGLTWEFYYGRNYQGDTSYSKNVYDDLIVYAVGLKADHVHAYDDGVVTEPTCTERGYTLHTCTICGRTFKDSFVDALGHDDKVIDHKDVTCEEDGFVTYKCDRCHEEHTEILTALGHDFAVVDEKAATCDESGYASYKCANCGETKYIYTPALGHNYQARVIKAATCTEDGEMEYYCTRCGEAYRVTVKAEHNYQLVETKAANCLESGYQLFRCSVCDDEYTIEIPADDAHAYVMEIVKNATKEEEGLIRYTCSVCGDEYTEVIPAFGDGIYVLLVQDNSPWCGNDNVSLLNRLVAGGYIAGWDLTSTANFGMLSLEKYAIILIANDQTTATYNNLSALGTAFNAYLEDGGVIIYGSCGYGWSNGSVGMLPGGVTTGNFYSMRNYIVNTSHPVVTGSLTDGMGLTDELLLGTYCSHVYFDAATLPEGYNVILQDANGNATLVEYAYGNGYVIASGLTWEFYYSRIYQGDTSYSKSVYDDLIVYAAGLKADHAHVYDEGVVTAPTCTEKGYTTHTCQECGKTFVDTITDALGHDYAVIAHADAACEEDGYTTYRCTRCGDEYTETIEAHGHDHQVSAHVDAGCEEDGYTTYTCVYCGDEYTETLEAHGHAWGEWQVLENDDKIRECAICHQTESIEYAYPEVSKFKKQVEGIGEITEQKEKLQAIKDAYAQYDALSDEEKVEATDVYEKLLVLAENYNRKAETMNAAHTDGIAKALGIFGKVSAFGAMLAVIFLVIKVII